jgi:hypothetical protein
VKICSTGVELFHADGWTDRRTDMTKLIVVFSNFANTPKNHGINERTSVQSGNVEKQSRISTQRKAT